MGLAILEVIASPKAATGTEVANEVSLLALTVTLSSLVLNTRTARKAQKKLPVFWAQKKQGVFLKKLPVFFKKLPAAKKLPVFFL
jgi:hypothetical protein